MTWHRACTVADVPLGQCLRVEIDDEDILLVNVDGDLHACSNICSHDYAVLHEGEVEGEEIICPLHLARFDVRTGEALTPPAYEPIATYPVRVTENVHVEIEIET
jgi:3-phenylpropionate/trans-cinnamate dioxygenase ferredoxin subunit